MRLHVAYTTRYLYSEPVAESHNEVRLMPFNDENQTRMQFKLSLLPSVPVFNYEHPFGRVHHFNLRKPHQELALKAESLVLTHRRTLFNESPENSGNGTIEPDFLRENYAEYLAPSERVPHLPGALELAREAQAQAAEPAPAQWMLQLMRVMHENFAYVPGSTTIETPLAQTLENRTGVCQDFTHLMLSAARQIGVPARYVSGYLHTGEVADETERRQQLSQPSVGSRESSGLSGGDATHAWVECLMPNAYWYGFDPTNNLLANDAYIKIHHGRDYDDVTPLRGVFKGASATSLEVSVRVVEDAVSSSR